MISRPWWATAAAISVLAATAVALVVACGSGIATGTALTNDASQQMGLVTIRTNTEIGVVGTLLHNDSQAPITIDAIKLAGKGLGTVVRPVETQIADGGPDSSVPQSVYVENPPVILTTGGCNVEALRPVAGYRLKPGGYVAVWTVVLGLRPGRFNLDRHLITYTQDGTRYQESTMQGFHGAVARGAPLLTTAAENSDGCWHHSHLLKGIPW